MLFRHLTIAKKGLLVLLLPLVYQVILFGVLLKRQRDLADAQEWVVHTKEALGQIDRVHLAMLRLQGALRGYVITQLPDFDREAEEVVRTLPGYITTLRLLTNSAPQQQREHLGRLADLVARRMAWHESVFSHIRAGDLAAAMEQIRALEGKRLMDAVQQEVEAFRSGAERLDQQRIEELRQTTAFQNRVLLTGLTLNVALGFGAAFFVGRNITRRIDLLSKNARRFSRGEKLQPVEEGNDELADLDRTFHAIAGELADAQRRERAFQAVLERRNADLERANRDLDHKNQENEMFVYSVSHDLRSPLVNLQGFSKELGLARDDLRTLLDHEFDERARQQARRVIDRDVSESIHYIQTAVMRLSAIIDALLRLSRAGRVEYQPELVDLNQLVARVVTALRGSTAEKDAEITVGDLPPAWGDPTALEQVFANLLANAVNYLDPARPGRIEVGYCTEPPAKADGLPTYFVKDNGLGIAEAYLPKVFAIFQRLHVDAAKGEGIGLTLVQRMVERHGGRIWVESRAGEGSTFYVSLPPRGQSPLTVAPRKESVRVAGRAEKPT
jgi:signal transduction histidine kinase